MGSQSADSSTVEKSPAKAILFSLFPGGGQIYNGKYLKAILIFSTEAYMVYQFQVNRSAYNKWNPETYPYPQHRYREKRNKYVWWIGFIYIYSMLDALVDSHLSGFDFDIVDEDRTEENNESDEEEGLKDQ